MKENDGLEARDGLYEGTVQLIKKLRLEIKPTKEAQHIRAALKIDSGKYYADEGSLIPGYVWDLVDIAVQTTLNTIASRPVDAALKSPPEPFQPAGKGKCEGCGTDGNTLWNKHGYKYCFTCRPSVDAALPHCPDGFALIKLGRFKPTPFSPVTYVTKTHPDTIRVDCVGEKNSYSFALPIAAAEGKK